MASSENDEMVELHFELEMSHQHASQEQIIIQSIAQIMEIPTQDVNIDKVEAIEDNQQHLLVKGHIPTTKNVIEQLVKKLYNSLSTQQLHQIITKHSGLKDPFIEIRELYETDQNDKEPVPGTLPSVQLAPLSPCSDTADQVSPS